MKKRIIVKNTYKKNYMYNIFVSSTKNKDLKNIYLYLNSSPYYFYNTITKGNFFYSWINFTN